MKMRLCLINVSSYERNGETRFKHNYIGQNGKYYSGTADQPMYAEEAIESDQYNDARAREYDVRFDVFDGKPTYRVSL